jgi:hypothetical protein
LSVANERARIASSARSTDARFCGRPMDLLSSSKNDCTPIETRSTPKRSSTASRSGVAVSGDVSTLHGTPPTSAPIPRTIITKSSSSCWALSQVGVPPPTATRAKDTSPSDSRTTRVCLASASRYARSKLASGRTVVNKLQNPQRISQNGTCT